MKSMILGFVAIVVIGIGSNAALKGAGFSSAERSASDAVRLK